MPFRPSSPVRPDGLTERQHAVFTFLYDHTRDRGYQPSYERVAAEFGFAGRSGTGFHLRALARAGWVELGDGSYRAIRVLRTPSGAPFRGFADREDVDG
jgi:SOS-response transcriptional repressor LexA